MDGNLKAFDHHHSVRNLLRSVHEKGVAMRIDQAKIRAYVQF
jgi:oligoribonuclease NrnB/cAMP/cGMP phosphodiesterase (DHH superfamily)